MVDINSEVHNCRENKRKTRKRSISDQKQTKRRPKIPFSFVFDAKQWECVDTNGWPEDIRGIGWRKRDEEEQNKP